MIHRIVCAGKINGEQFFLRRNFMGLIEWYIEYKIIVKFVLEIGNFWWMEYWIKLQLSSRFWSRCWLIKIKVQAQIMTINQFLMQMQFWCYNLARLAKIYVSMFPQIIFSIQNRKFLFKEIVAYIVVPTLTFLKHTLNWALWDVYIVLGIRAKFASLQEEFTRRAVSPSIPFVHPDVQST